MTTIRDAMTDPALFGPIFGGESFTAWRALLSGFYGLELDATELDLFESLTERDSAPDSAFLELWLANRAQGRQEPCSGVSGRVSGRVSGLPRQVGTGRGCHRHGHRC